MSRLSQNHKLGSNGRWLAYRCVRVFVCVCVCAHVCAFQLKCRPIQDVCCIDLGEREHFYITCKKMEVGLQQPTGNLNMKPEQCENSVKYYAQQWYKSHASVVKNKPFTSEAMLQMFLV